MRLSVEQRAAAGRLSGATRVVAGAGTGKTAVIAERFRRLVKRGTDPASILVMTFSDRAAREMRARIEGVTGDLPPAVGTFHSLAMAWLREDGRAVGVLPTFRIQAGADRWIALRELMWELGDPALVGDQRPDDLVTPLLKVMERLKQELVPLNRLREWCAEDPADERAETLGAAVRLFAEHRRRNRAAALLDFDDVLVEAVRLLESRSALDRYRARYRHVMVDEYQDTNLAQERVVELLGGGAESVFVVGDDDQSIYRFRGAALASMNRFLRVFPGAETVKLGANRRSTRAIVESAASLVRGNAGRIDKDLRSGAVAGAPVTIIAAGDGTAEAAALVTAIEDLAASGTPLSEIAVLCRTHAMAGPIVARLRSRGVPHRHLGAGGMLGVPEVRDAIAMLRLVADPDDLHALARVVQRPPVAGSLETALGLVRQQAGRSPLQVLAAYPPAAPIAGALLELRALSATAGVGDLFFELMTRTRLLELHSNDARAQAALTRFAEVVDEFAERSRDQSLSAFLERLALVLLSGQDEELGEADVDVDAGGVRVMTIHQAKGLEFDAVFVPGLVEGRLPQPARRSGFELPAEILEPAVRRREDHLAEERRLAYVALTRARRCAFLSFAATYEGDRAWPPSRFLAEIEAAGHSTRVNAPAAPPAADEPAPPRPASTAAAASFSFSSIAAYRECPAQHRYRYVLGLPAPETVEGQYGTVVHAALMRLGRLRQGGSRVSVSDVEATLEEEWASVRPVDGRRLPTLRRLAATQLERFVESGGFAEPPARIEERFATQVDGWELRGVIDRVDAPGDEAAAWRIVDYKTGSALPRSRLRRDLQLSLYALGARSALGLDRAELEIVYLKAGKRVSIAATDELLAEAREAAAAAVAGIRGGAFEPRPERRRCSLCAYRLACPAGL